MRKHISLIFLLMGLGLTGARAQSDPATGTSTRHDVVVDTIIIAGNKTTRPHIITRELMFRQNDTLLIAILPSLLEKSRSNLLNISLFNFVTIETQKRDTGHIAIIVSVVERWYLWPYPVFELADRNFNAWWRARNLSRVSYGVNLIWHNFRGRRESLSLFTLLGHDHKLSLEYQIPYINKYQKTGISFGASIGRTHEVAALTDSSNGVLFVRDETRYLKTESGAWISLSYRPSYNLTHYLTASYNYYHADSFLLTVNPTYGSLQALFFSLAYQFKADYRDYKHYPLNGWYADFYLEKTGMPIGGSKNVDYWKAEANLRYYRYLNRGWYWAAGLYTGISDNHHPPYPLAGGLGYGRNFVRGYEYYVIEGYRQALARLNIKYALIPTKVYDIRPIRTQKFSKVHYAFYLNFFSDAGYSARWPGTLPTLLNNRILYSTGAGLDFVTYYDKVLRVEYTLNHLGQTGLYIHFIASI